jgi:hypothetical protein
LWAGWARGALRPATAAAEYRGGQVELLRASYIGVAASFLAALLALNCARRARFRFDRSVRRAGKGLVRAGRWLAWSGLYFALTGALALGFYGLLRLRS